MERMKASDFPQELLDLFHLYVHGDIDGPGPGDDHPIGMMSAQCATA